MLLQLRNISKSYGTGAARAEVLKDINLAIEEGEFVAIVGFSGSGKTTLISLMAGLIAPDSHQVLLNGNPIKEPGPDRGVVFQSYSLMPWLTVHGNIALAVDSVYSRESRAERKARVQHYVDLVGLTHAADRRPAELSGGMRQRVALARALAMNPQILLLDEPLSALDALTRSKLQLELDRIWECERKTVVLITNDVDEAILLADRIIPLNPGPGATLGPSFKVNLPRPREAATINRDPSFQKLRTEITQYLMKVRRIRSAGREDERQLPHVIPIAHVQPPKVYTDAATSRLRERYVEFSQVRKIYRTPSGPFTVVDGFDLKMRKGEFVSLIGHSGCGKSTILSMAAGLINLTDGGIILDGKEVTAAGPDRAVVFQAPSLLPWLTARGNVALGVDHVYSRATAEERRLVVEYYLARVGLADSMDKLASELSNGMQQRVGIARAFALSPKLLLLDEPFGMLDSLTRWELQEVLMEVWRRTQVTAVCVTHDVDEAILLADRVVMMTNGPRARVGKFIEIEMERPRTRKMLLEHPKYYSYRGELLTFLRECEAAGSPQAPKSAKCASELAISCAIDQ